MMQPIPALAVLLAAAFAASAADDAPAGLPTKHPLLEQLDHDEYDLRESATRQLILLGQQVVPVLKRAALEGSAEVSWRAIFALGEIAVAEELDRRNPAEDVLAELQHSADLSVARRSEELLKALPASREARAVEMVRSLGGRIDESGSVVTLDGQWTGGDKGLRYIRHVTALRHVHIEPTANIGKPALAQFRANLPKGITVTQFGTAFLGVGAASNEGGGGMRVLTVGAGSPAAEAGLREGDVITGIDRAAVANFNDLVAIIREKNAGDEVTIKFTRTDADTGVTKADEVKVKLGARPGATAPSK